jgi:adenosylmethionine-8-amino-7-oxononanoate aminotransferase
LQARYARSCEQRGLILRAIGDTRSLRPPLIISQDEIDAALTRLMAALDETAAQIAR